MSKSAGKSGDSKGIPDLNGEFPPNADEAKNLPKDEELTPEQAERKMADKSKEMHCAITGQGNRLDQSAINESEWS
jgi:hypothetical protein